MTKINFNDLTQLRELAKLKRENPEEYKQFFKDLKGVMIDMLKVAKEISEEME